MVLLLCKALTLIPLFAKVDLSQDPDFDIESDDVSSRFIYIEVST